MRRVAIPDKTAPRSVQVGITASRGGLQPPAMLATRIIRPIPSDPLSSLSTCPGWSIWVLLRCARLERLLPLECRDKCFQCTFVLALGGVQLSLLVLQWS